MPWGTMSIVLYEKLLNLIILQYNIVIGVIIPHRYNFQKRAYWVHIHGLQSPLFPLK